MRNDLEKQLYEIDPVFFEEAIACENNKMDERNTCMAFGCECGDGWFEPLKKFVEKIALINLNAKKYNIKFVCNQLKEKFGYLRVYYTNKLIDSTKITNENIPAINILVSLFEDALDACVNECSSVCEICGREGGVDNENLIQTSGWIKIICKECAFKENKTDTISRFHDAYKFLNPYYSHYVFSYKGKFYKSVPQAFFSIIDPKHEMLYQRISNLTDESLNAACVIRQIANEFGFDFNDSNLNILNEIVKAKFNNNNYNFSNKNLIETNDKKLIYMNNDHDNFLGHCTCEKCKDKPHFNHYGKMLMEIREDLKKHICNKFYDHKNAINFADEIFNLTGIKMYVIEDETESGLPSYIVTNDKNYKIKK